MFRHLSIRLALVAAVTGGLVAVGAALLFFSVTTHSLVRIADADLTDRSAEVEAYLQSAGPQPLRPHPRAAALTAFTQVLRPDGSIVFSSSPAAGTRPIVPMSTVRSLTDRDVRFFNRSVPGLAGEARLRASTFTLEGQQYIVVVGDDFDDFNAAARRIHTLLVLVVIGCAIAAGGVGFVLVRRALGGIQRLAAEADGLSVALPPGRVPDQSTHELQRLADRLNAMLLRLADASRREQHFIAEASHDLLGPLATLRLQLELAAHEGPGAGQHDLVREAADTVGRLADQASAMLDLGRLRATALDHEVRTAVELAPMAREIADLVGLGRPGVGLETVGAVTAWADPIDVRQALNNVIDNAFRHAVGKVTIFLGGSPTVATIRVADDGAGFPDPVLTAFADEHPRYGSYTHGHGLGLAAARAAARRNGGDLTIRNAARGGEVRLSLPITN